MKMLYWGIVILLSISVTNSVAAGDWNGKSCAFTFSTDDGNIDNLVWTDVFKEFGYTYTLFINTAKIGKRGKLTAFDINHLHSDGFEIASHSVNHKPLNPKEVLRVRYTGDALFCRMQVEDDILYVDSKIEAESFQISLTDENYDRTSELAHFLESKRFNVEVFNYPRIARFFYHSAYLEPFDWVPVKQSSYTLLSRDGTTDEECKHEIFQSKADLEAIVNDGSYKCLTFAYPYHAHSERAIADLEEAGYIAARNGGRSHPTSWGKVYLNLYTVPLSKMLYNIVGPYNSLSEEETRQNVRRMLEIGKKQNKWLNIYTHRLEGESSCDEAHMRYILDEISQNGDVWVDNFANVAKFIISAECSKCDLDNDSGVDGKDLEIFSVHFGNRDCVSGSTSDFDNDGDVDGVDLAILADFLGQTNCGEY